MSQQDLLKLVIKPLDAAEGDKVDFWLLTEDAFDQSRFARKYEEEVFGIRLRVSAPEDTILQKLRWSTLSGGSEKLYGDALRVYEVQHPCVPPPMYNSPHPGEFITGVI